MSQKPPPPPVPPPSSRQPAWRNEPGYDDGPLPPLWEGVDRARFWLWIAFGAWALLMLTMHRLTMQRDLSAIQAGAVAADTAAWLVGGYCIMRAINGAILSSKSRQD